jgi:hypothetical protein
MKPGPGAIGLALLLSAVACRRHRSEIGTAIVKPLDHSLSLEYQEVQLPKVSEHCRIWILRSTSSTRPKPAVFICASSSDFETKALLSDPQKHEFEEFAVNGYIVVAYEAPINVVTDAHDLNTASRSKEMNLFVKRQGGAAYGRLALDYALRTLPVNPLRLYAVGTGTSGTRALMLASLDSRVRGCVAISPTLDWPTSGGLPNAASLKSLDPRLLVQKVLCPVLVGAEEGSKEQTLLSRKSTNSHGEITTIKIDSENESLGTLALPWLDRDHKRKG